MYETVIVLVMVAVLVLGLLWVVDALTSGDTTTTSHIVVSDLLLFTHVCIMGESDVAYPNISMSVCDYSLQDIQGVLFYVPLLYSCSAMLGVLMTSVCTPVGFSHLFTVLGKVIVQPKVSYNPSI